MKDDPIYGWQVEKPKGKMHKISFNSGVNIYFKSYAQRARDLQTGSAYAIFADEEMPVDLIPEIQSRLRATDGYLNSVFTATLGQDFWRRVMEPVNKKEEIYPNAYKRQVSLYDAQKYMSGKPSRWTNQRIQQIITECGTESEIQRRVFGRFVKSEGLLFESFDLTRNMITPFKIPKTYEIYSGVDPGSGGKSGHPAAMVFIAVRPDYREGFVFRARRMDNIATANPDILNEYRTLSQDLTITAQVYDYKDKDFYLVAQGQQIDFQPAVKTRKEGFGLLNSLLKNGMLKLFNDDPEISKLVTEFQLLPAEIDSRKKNTDDLSDATRYAVMAIPWDFSGAIHQLTPTKDKFNDPPLDNRTDEEIQAQQFLEDRRNFALNKISAKDDTENEYDYWNDMYGD
jgi:hypothetical protein